jgi:hypothetical protein
MCRDDISEPAPEVNFPDANPSDSQSGVHGGLAIARIAVWFVLKLAVQSFAVPSFGTHSFNADLRHLTEVGVRSDAANASGVRLI